MDLETLNVAPPERGALGVGGLGAKAPDKQAPKIAVKPCSHNVGAWFHPITDHYVLLSVGGIPPGLGVGDVWVGAKGRTERL